MLYSLPDSARIVILICHSESKPVRPLAEGICSMYADPSIPLRFTRDDKIYKHTPRRRPGSISILRGMHNKIIPTARAARAWCWIPACAGMTKRKAGMGHFCRRLLLRTRRKHQAPRSQASSRYRASLYVSYHHRLAPVLRIPQLRVFQGGNIRGRPSNRAPAWRVRMGVR